MRAVLITAYGEIPEVTDVHDPKVPDDGVILKVEATGLCRSDWHAFLGHEPVQLPHVPGHEVAGTIAAVGHNVKHWAVGDRVTLPFVCACGDCPECRSGNHQVCRNQIQPGFTCWGTYAEYAAIPRADVNLVRLPDAMTFVEAAGLGCRFATAYRAVRQVARIQPGEKLAVFGCGGVGLSAVMIAVAAGAEVIAVDVNPAALELARAHGAHTTLEMQRSISRDLKSMTDGGVDATIDAIGSGDVIQASLRSLRPLGRHVQVGLLSGPVELKLAGLYGNELQMLGAHGMSAKSYPEMLAEIVDGALQPGQLVTRTISLEEAGPALAGMSSSSPIGVTVITP